MKEIGLILGLIVAFAVGYCAVDRLGRFIEQNLRAAFTHRDEEPSRRQIEAKCKAELNSDNWLNHSGKQ